MSRPYKWILTVHISISQWIVWKNICIVINVIKWTIRKGWASKNWCFWTVVLEKTLESPLDYKEIKPVNPKGNQSWIFIGGSDAEAEAPILWLPDVKDWLIWKDPDAGKDWRQEEKGMTEDKMVGWHHQLNGHEFGLATGDGEGQGNLVCCSPWCHKELDTTECLNSSNNKMNDLAFCFIIFKVKSILRPYYINLFFILVFLYRFYLQARILLSLLSISMIECDPTQSVMA